MDAKKGTSENMDTKEDTSQLKGSLLIGENIMVGPPRTSPLCAVTFVDAVRNGKVWKHTSKWREITERILVRGK